MNAKVSALIFITCFSLPTIASDGIIKIQSESGVETTTDRLTSVLENAGMTIFAKIDHAAAAKKVGTGLRPTQLIIFGNPKIGAKLMACQQSVGLDLPQKALITEDKNGLVWISYNNPSYLTKRHSITGCDALLSKVETALDTLINRSAMEAR